MHTIARADAELVDLLVALRGGPHWTPANIHAAITAADAHGLPWPTTMRTLLRLAERPHGKPSDLG